MSQFDETTDAEVKKYNTDPRLFRMGRNSAKESLVILAKGLEAVKHRGHSDYCPMGNCNCGHDDLLMAISKVKERGDWPL